MGGKTAWTRVSVLVLAALGGWALLHSDAPIPPTPAAPAGGLEGRPDLGPEPGTTAAGDASVEAALPPPVDLARVDRDLDLHGVVVDFGGRPVAGARIEALSYPWRQAYLFRMDAQETAVVGPHTISAADGTFALRLARGRPVDLRVSAAGFAATEWLDRQAGERVRVVLGPGLRLSVRVVDAAGRAVEGASVRFYRDRRMSLERIERTGTSDAAGRLELAGLPPKASGFLVVRHPAYAIPELQRVDLSEGATTQATVRLATGRAIRGSVLDDADGQPLAATQVGLGWTLAKAVTTGPDGRFLLEGYSPAYGSLVVSAAGYGVAALAAPEGEEPLVVRLRRGVVVTGTLVDAEGQAVPAALVAMIGGENGSNGVYGEGGAEGRFRLAGVPRGAPRTFVAAAPGFGQLALDVDIPEQDTLDLGAVVLPPAAKIEGTVTRRDGSPASGIPVALAGVAADRGRLRPEQELVYLGRQASARRARTDDLGRFAFGDLAPGTYTISAEPLGWRWLEQEVLLAEGQRSAATRFELAGGVPLRVRVRAEDGTPVPGVEVTAVMADGYSIGLTADGEGEAQLEGDRPFTQVEVLPIVVHRLVLAPPAVELKPDQREVEITLRTAEIARGRLIDVDGRPLPHTPLEVLCDGAPLIQQSAFSGHLVFSDPTGAFEVRVPTGAEVTVRGSPRLLDDGRVVVGEASRVRGGAAFEVRQRVVASDRSLRVRALAPDGAPAADVQVFARVARRDVPGANVCTDAEGWARLERLPGVELLVQAMALAGAPGRERWMRWSSGQVEPRGQDLEVRFVTGTWIEGRVLDDEDSPVAGAQVSLLSSTAVLDTATSDAEGRFRFLVAPDAPGPLRLAAATQTAIAAPQAVTLGDPPVTLSLRR